MKDAGSESSLALSGYLSATLLYSQEKRGRGLEPRARTNRPFLKGPESKQG